MLLSVGSLQAWQQHELAKGFFDVEPLPEAKLADEQIKRAHRNRMMAVLLQTCLSETDKVKRKSVAQGCLADAAKRGIALPELMTSAAGKAIKMSL